MSTWNPWKVTAIAMALVMSTALVTGLVVANWTGSNAKPEPTATETAKGDTIKSDKAKAPAKPAARTASAQTTQTPAAPMAPTQAAVDACNQWAAQQTGPQDKTMEVVKDGAVGALVGAAVGAAGGAVAGGGKGAGKGAAIGGAVGAGGGALYGLNENRKHDERYRNAYASCMRARGYAV
jgi:hypothetical protein